MLFKKKSKNIELVESADIEAPAHIAIIMDGNGRWAKGRMLPRSVGHKRGAETVRKCVENCLDLGVQYLTLYAFSSENWNRPDEEVKDLMGLLRHYLLNEVEELYERGVRMRFIGNRGRLSDKLNELIDFAEAKTGGNTKLQMVIALSYGGRDELIQATQKIAKRVETGELKAEQIDEALFTSELYTFDIPDPDLIIRTSGEQRLSNFLLWQAAYAEFVFLDVLWPDFGRDELVEAINEFHGRDRRFGLRP